MWNLFNDIMQEAIEKFVPRKSTTLESHKSVWLTGKVLRQMRKKTQIVKKCRKKNSNKVINNTLADTTELNYKKQANKAK